MNAHRVEIFHVAHRDAVVGAVADDLILDFFPSAQIFLDKHLRYTCLSDARSQVAEDFGKLRHEFLLTAYDSRALAVKRESRANHDGIADLLCGSNRLLGVHCRSASRGFHADFPQLPHKEVAVLGVAYRRNGSAEDSDTVFFENAALFEREAEIERGLPAEGQGDGVGAFLAYDLRREFLGEREGINYVSALIICLHRRDVGIHKDDAHAVLFERLDRLRTRIVEFARLADAEASRAE